MTRRQSHALSLAHIVLILAGAAVLAVAAAWLLRQPGSPRYPIRNILLISVDTCRADHLSCYGYQRQTTPHIDALAKEGILFENAISPVPVTLPAHCTMLTGTIPPYHGVHDNLEFRLADSYLTLPEILKEQGFATSAVIGAFVMDSQFGLSQGFDTYHDRIEQDLDNPVVQRRGAEVSHHAIEWLRQHHQDPFFLFLHYYDPHGDYTPPEPFATQFAGLPYAGEIAYTDHCIGQVIDELKSLDLFDSTMIILTSDHGEMLGEHGEATHSYFIYQSAIRVPLIFKLPAQQTSRRITEPAGLVDIVPTICGLLSIAPPADVQGTDLSKWFGSRRPSSRERHLYCGSLWPTKYEANPLLGVMSGRFKYIHTTRDELYNLQTDPAETDNLAASQPLQARKMQDQLQQILQEHAGNDQVDSKWAAGAQAVERVEALGYLGGAATSSDLHIDPDRDDPKDLINFHETHVVVGSHLFKGMFAPARRLSERLVAERPQFWGAHHKLGASMVGLGQLEEGIGHYRRAVQLERNSAKARLDLARLLTSAKHYDEAIGHYQKVSQLTPFDPDPHFYLGGALVGQKKVSDAVASYRQALKLDPEHAGAHYKLAQLLLGEGKWDGAVLHLQASLAVEPENASALGNLAVALERQGNLDGAISHFRRSLELKPFAETHYNLGNALRKQGKLDEAADQYRKALDLNGNDVKSMNNLGMTLSVQRRWAEAIELYRRALVIEPNDARAHYNLAQALQSDGRAVDSIDHYREAVRLQPNWVGPLNGLAWMLATHPDARANHPKQALELALRAAELTEHRQPSVLDTLAVAHAAAGDFENAVKTAERALDLFGAGEQQVSTQTMDRIHARLQRYRQGKAYVEPQD